MQSNAIKVIQNFVMRVSIGIDIIFAERKGSNVLVVSNMHIGIMIAEDSYLPEYRTLPSCNMMTRSNKLYTAGEGWSNEQKTVLPIRLHT